MSKFYDFEAEDVMCNMHKMEEYQGKVVLIVNTATRCGFTPQYDDLQNLYEQSVWKSGTGHQRGDRVIL